MMVQCVTHVDNNQYLVSAGSVQNVLIMTYVQSVTMQINITLDTDFTELQLLEVKGKLTL